MPNKRAHAARVAQDASVPENHAITMDWQLIFEGHVLAVFGRSLASEIRARPERNGSHSISRIKATTYNAAKTVLQIANRETVVEEDLQSTLIHPDFPRTAVSRPKISRNSSANG